MRTTGEITATASTPGSSTPLTGAEFAAAHIDDDDLDVYPLPRAIQGTAGQIAATVIALHRDRVAVPEHLSDAASRLLVVYAAAAQA